MPHTYRWDALYGCRKRMKLKHSVWGEKWIQVKGRGLGLGTQGPGWGLRPALKRRESRAESVYHEAQPGEALQPCLPLIHEHPPGCSSLSGCTQTSSPWVPPMRSGDREGTCQQRHRYTLSMCTAWPVAASWDTKQHSTLPTLWEFISEEDTDPRRPHDSRTQ